MVPGPCYVYGKVHSTVSRGLNGFWNPGHLASKGAAICTKKWMIYLNNDLRQETENCKSIPGNSSVEVAFVQTWHKDPKLVVGSTVGFFVQITKMPFLSKIILTSYAYANLSSIFKICQPQ